MGPDEGAQYDDEDLDNQPEFLIMELRSTAAFKDVDVDTMLEQTNFDEFMRGLYFNRVSSSSSQPQDGQSQFNQMINEIFKAPAQADPAEELKLRFGGSEADARSEQLALEQMVN